MTYQNTTGTLSPGAHAGSYNGQDAYSDMLITNENDFNESQLYAHGRNTGRDGSLALCDGQQRPANRDDNQWGGVIR